MPLDRLLVAATNELPHNELQVLVSTAQQMLFFHWFVDFFGSIWSTIIEACLAHACGALSVTSF